MNNPISLQIQATSIANTLNIKLTYPGLPNLTYNFKLVLSVHEEDIVTRTDKKVYERVFHTVQKQIVVQGLQYCKMYKVVGRMTVGRQQETIKNVFVFTKAEDAHQRQNHQQSSQSQEQRSYFQHRSQMNSSFNSSSNERPIRNVQRLNERPPSSGNANNMGKTKLSKAKNSYNPNVQLSNSELLMKTVGQTSHLGNKNQLHKYILDGRKCRNIQEFLNEKESFKNNSRKEVLNKKMLLVKGKLLFSQIYKYREGSQFFKNDWHMGPFYSYDHNQESIRRQ